MRWIDLERWPRAGHYRKFCDYEKPYFSMSAQLDLTRFRSWLQQRNESFFPWMVHLASRAANELPEFRQRIRGAAIVEHEMVHPSVTVMTESGLFGYCRLEYRADGNAFVAAAASALQQAKAQPAVSTLQEEDDLLFITSVPWLAFTGISHAMKGDDSDAVPRIAWSKYERQGERWVMTLAVQAHHGLADGWHIARYFERLQELLNNEIER